MNKIRCMIISGGQRHEVFMELSQPEVSEIILTGKVVKHGRWFFAI